ncbi:4-(cytidine 5'-diphospho)-2-C-methyl-D-erythritol kinase [Geofilum rubicundum]|uniref:4-diphosphocytidyl-2-C-methyl-D-erythritol kinase n=1 Tax=Geofilum rubicundum JCM 15548 TaxID=1236989 RepID=A0A0E9LSV8_9BACT|nr:4-(cytidine 5'-diphospho)-2-C-methyl-D-erythritol kinase [Geofilum rubicundum]GAO28241.1 4-diphosphocytidyl-2-C-methyl-D-erythritol kinase [Geofilum rubicundum JCM 15548]
MIVFPNAKINLGLLVTSKRPDGYHNIETIFHPVHQLCDILEVIDNDEKEDVFSTSGLVIDGPASDNLILKALALIRECAPLPPLKIHLHKKIPFGAGLGGGSADASFMLKLLNEQYHLNLSTRTLELMAARLGADCPVFIENKPVLARGIGNEFSPINLSLSHLWLQIVIPPIHVPTAHAYSNISPFQPESSLEDLLSRPIENWKATLKNDFESSVFERYPEIMAIKEHLYNQGALYAAMSGSGSAVFGLFKNKPETEWADNYVIHTEQL